MKWCTINEDYLNYLKSIETRIPNYFYHQTRPDGTEKKLYKPFFYSLYEVGDMVYVGQVNHYQERHSRISESLDFKKIYDPHNTRLPLCVINLNYMFPVPKKELQELKYTDINLLRDFDNDKERSQYIGLLRKELAEISRKNLHIDAVKLYNLKNSNPHHPISKRSFDFAVLEEKCKEWIVTKHKNKL